MRSRKIVVPGDPRGKGRPRFANGHAYTPEKTRAYEELIRACWYDQADGWKSTDAPLGIMVIAYMRIPKSVSKATKRDMKSGRLVPAKPPDGDNILKVVLDALNGYAYRDDRQIVSMMVRKWYSDEPRLEIVLHDC